MSVYNTIKEDYWTLFEDGTTQHCKQDTNFSPAEYPQAWETVE